MLLPTIHSNFLLQAFKLQEESHVNQFLMNLSPKFEIVRGALMNQEISPDLNTCVQVVVRDEIRLQTQHSILDEPKAFVSPTSKEAAPS